MKKPSTREKLQKPLSLYPMSFNEALDTLLSAKPKKKSPKQNDEQIKEEEDKKAP